MFFKLRFLVPNVCVPSVAVDFVPVIFVNMLPGVEHFLDVLISIIVCLCDIVCI